MCMACNDVLHVCSTETCTCGVATVESSLLRSLPHDARWLRCVCPVSGLVAAEPSLQLSPKRMHTGLPRMVQGGNYSAFKHITSHAKVPDKPFHASSRSR